MDQFTAHLDRGWDLVQRGDYAGARVSAQKGLELDAASPEAYNLLGYIHAAEGNAEEALDAYRQAIELDETFVEAMLNAAEVLIHPLSDYDGALRMVEEALDFLEDDEERADAMLLRIDVLLAKGDREAAVRAVRALPDGPFDSPALEFLVGRALFEVGDLEHAEKHVRSAAAADAGNGEAQYYLGLVCEARGDLRGATVAFLRAREIDLSLPPLSWSLPPEQFERRVRAAIARLPAELSAVLEGALVVVGDVPGLEVVADGVDPRMPVLVDDVTGQAERPLAGRVFVYQRNVERNSNGLLGVEDELLRVLEGELNALFPPPDSAPTEAGRRGPSSAE
jgi:Flp pilus assembly protein TadD